MTDIQDLQGKLYDAFDHDPTPVVDFLVWLTGRYPLPKNLRALDMGAGVGRLLTPFAALGWQVTGMEPDADFLEKAKENTAALNGKVKLVQGGFDTLDAKETYDLITMVNDPFAYLLTIDERVEALDRLYRALRPGGLIFLEIKNFLFKLQHDEALTEDEREIDGERVVHICQHEIDAHRALWIHRDEYLVEGLDKAIRKEHRIAIIPAPELLYFLRKQGFVNIQTYPDYDAREPGEVNDRLILVSARKAGNEYE